MTFIFALPIFGIQLSAILPFTSLILALSFVFGGSAKNTFDCLVFLFAQHPFDAGDRVIVNDKTLIVESGMSVAFIKSRYIYNFHEKSIFINNYVYNC